MFNKVNAEKITHCWNNFSLRVVFLLCGGNIDSTVLGRVIERGLAADGRLVRFSVVISDRPGGLAELTKILADHGARQEILC